MRRTISTHKIRFYRPGTQTLIDGEVTYTPPTDLGEIAGSLQPLEQGTRFGEIVKVLPSGLDSTSIKLFYTSVSTLRGVNRYENHDSDYCTLSDGVYVVFQTGDWQVPTFSTAHSLYVLVRRPASTGDIPR
jgi:hypothetical protein